MVELQAMPLTAEAFAPYGEVIELSAARRFPINNGLTTRFHDLLTIDADHERGYGRGSKKPVHHRRNARQDFEDRLDG